MLRTLEDSAPTITRHFVLSKYTAFQRRNRRLRLFDTLRPPRHELNVLMQFHWWITGCEGLDVHSRWSDVGHYSRQADIFRRAECIDSVAVNATNEHLLCFEYAGALLQVPQA